MRYRRLPVIVEAIQLAKPMSIEVDGIPLEGGIGDWLTFGPSDKIEFMVDADFKLAYEPFNEEMPKWFSRKTRKDIGKPRKKRIEDAQHISMIKSS